MTSPKIQINISKGISKMRKYLLPRNGKFYKANMHTHTTISDGKLSPEEIKESYKEKGYSIVAYTDHEVIIPHNDLRDEDFLPITSFELSICEPWNVYAKCYHMNVYFRDPDTGASKTFSDLYGVGHSREHITEKMRELSAGKRNYSKEYAQWIIDTAKSEGALVSLNHPVWSLQTHEDYSGLRGIWGIEWFNTSAVILGYHDTYQPIRDLLAEGEKKVFPLATDDCHSKIDRFGGWLSVKAPKLDYDAVFTALEKGDFYSSTGPEIKSLYIEDGIITVKTSSAAIIHLFTGQRLAMRVMEEGKLVREAKFDLAKIFEKWEEAPEDKHTWLAIRVTDKFGKVAITRAYFKKELISKRK